MTEIIFSFNSDWSKFNLSAKLTRCKLLQRNQTIQNYTLTHFKFVEIEIGRGFLLTCKFTSSFIILLNKIFLDSGLI